MHGDLSETVSFSAGDAREPFLPGRCHPTHPKTMGSFCSRSVPKGPEKGSTGVTPPTSSCNCRLAGPVPLRLSALSRLTYCYLRTGYLGHSALVSRYRTEGGSHSTIGMVLLYVGPFLAPQRGALVSRVGSKAQCLRFYSWGLLDKSEVADPVRGWIQLDVMPPGSCRTDNQPDTAVTLLRHQATFVVVVSAHMLMIFIDASEIALEPIRRRPIGPEGRPILGREGPAAGRLS